MTFVYRNSSCKLADETEDLGAGPTLTSPTAASE